MALVDVFDALTNKRVYKPAWTIEETVIYIQEKKGSHFDPLVVEAFIDQLERFSLIWRTSADL